MLPLPGFLLHEILPKGNGVKSGMKTNAAYNVTGADRTGRYVITCDHASNHVPEWVAGGDLGIPASDMARHIAYDVGVLGTAQQMGALLDSPVIASNFSRLVIDPNRGLDDPTLIMQIYDGTPIPANHNLDAANRQKRIDDLYTPYHTAYAELLNSRDAPIIIAMHSFTTQLMGRGKRPWEIGILYAADQRLSDPLIAELESGGDLTIGHNQPYNGHLPDDSVAQHALAHGHLNALIEIRNDLIEDEGNHAHWAERLATAIQTAQQKI